MEDITYRAIRILQESDLVAAEDTRHTRKLLTHFDIHTPLISYHEHNKKDRGGMLIERILSGETVALVSDAGLPGVSDPGADLVKLAIEAGIEVSPIPGPNAALSALVCSGLDTRTFFFAGFLPKTTKKRRDFITEIAKYPHTLIFYETPHRLNDTLQELKNILGDRPAAAGRELTKRFEEFKRGTLGSLYDFFQQTEPRGEFTLVVGGAGEDDAQALEEKQVAPADAVAELIAAGMQKKEAIRTVAVRYGLARRDVYQLVIAGEQ
jgi:16S rRNA (cytidine1402-2'-O)-methyltransferase